MEITIIKAGIDLLKKQHYYDQSTVVKKLRRLGKTISEPTLSNVLNGKNVRPATLQLVCQGIQELVRLEAGMEWKNDAFTPLDKSEWTPVAIPPLDIRDPSIIAKPGYAFHENGRLPISEKVAFISTAQFEVIEFGVTLHTFASYFINRGEWEFASKIEALLEKGVNFKCYLLDPECNEARLYFDDRKRVQPHEAKSIETIRQVIQQLIQIQNGFIEKKLAGAFEIYTYKHIPYNHFLAVDGHSVNGKMMISHYIYGESRANCPVIEFEKSANSTLYKRYWNSLQQLIQHAKPINK